MTHDLLRNVIRQIEGDVTRVVINSLEENTFYAQIHIKLANRELTVDSRPSYAIALALRAHAPLFVEESVLEKSRAGDESAEANGAERLRKWLEDADPDSLGKYKM
jgi:bifunctional DNase/RNase